MLAPASAFDRQRVELVFRRPLIVGDLIRDWSITATDEVLFPYAEGETGTLEAMPQLARWLWQTRTTLGNRATFGKSTYFNEGRPWWAWHQVALRRIDTPLTFTYAFVATHNHFSLDRGGKVFSRSAPVIKLPSGCSIEQHLGLLGLLNSSVACFWMKQVCHNKGIRGEGGGITAEAWEQFHEFVSTALGQFPFVPACRQTVQMNWTVWRVHMPVFWPARC